MEGNTKIEEDPYTKASVISRITLWWITDIFRIALKRPLTPNDVQSSLPWGKTQLQVDLISKRWSSKRQHSTKKTSTGFVRALVGHVWKKLTLALILSIIGESMKFAMPLCVAELVHHFEAPHESNIANSWVAGVVLFLLLLLYGYLQINYTYINQVVSMQLRTTCAGLIYRKLLRMNMSMKNAPKTGHVTTLLSTDIERFSKSVATVQSIVVVPLLLLVFSVVEGLEMGLPILAGLGFIFIFQFIRIGMGKLQSNAWKAALEWTDKRVQQMTEIVTSMRVVKMYCWESNVAKKAADLRSQETVRQRTNIFLNAFGCSLNHSAGNLAIFFTVITYVYMGNELRPTTAVKLIGWIHLMENMVFINLPTSVSSLLETRVSLTRIKKFLELDELPEKQKKSSIKHTEEVSLELEKVGASYDLKAENGLNIRDISLTFQSGELVAVIGPVGAGKTTLLMTCLEELPVLEGQLKVSGSTALVPQEAWLVPASVQTNILLHADLDIDRYHQAIHVCQLQPDLDDLPKGDQTPVGERGQILSGGQKARINLARAVYSDADIMLLDDPLSAVDPKVGSDIFEKCICGTLKGKLRILVTHHLEYLPKADRIVVMEKGRVVAVGSYEELSTQMDLSEFMKQEESVEDLSSTPPEESNQKNQDDLTRLLTRWDKRQRELMAGTPSKTNKPKQGEKTGDKQLLLSTDKVDEVQKLGKWSEGERNARGVVSFRVYYNYFLSGYGLFLLPLLVLLLILVVSSEIVAEWWLSEWYTTGENSPQPSHNQSSDDLVINSTSDYHVAIDTDMRVVILAGLMGVHLVMNVCQALLLAVICVTAAKKIYCTMFERIMRAPMSFFETNSTGGIINRFARDTNFMDDRIPGILAIGFPVVVAFFGTMVYICIICPWAVICVVVLSISVPLVYHFTMNGMRDLKRLEAGFRSTTFTHLTASVQGLPIIRAFNLEQSFIQESDERMDQHVMAWYLYFTAERFYSVFLNQVVAVLVFLIVTILLILPDNVGEGGSKGLAITYSIFAIAYVRLASLKYASLETLMTSVERILQFSRVEQEAPQRTDIHPPPGWPMEGGIQLSNVCLQYQNTGRLALGPITVNIQPREKIAIVGRTGAGKTSLFACLLRISEPVGSIRIDGLETTLIGLDDLRQNISVIPQDPVLFSGPLRDNLDPYHEFTDDELWATLEQVQMQSAVREMAGGLYAETGETGKNVSAGQRQLLCLCRAFLRRNNIILVDEATANVDLSTDLVIQEMIKRRLASKTVLTIAHRLNTAIHYDKIMVLDKGKMIEFDHPYNLLRDSEGTFYQMVLPLGEEMLKQLRDIAKANYQLNQ